MSEWISVKDRLPDGVGRQGVVVFVPDKRPSPYKVCSFYRGEFQNCVTEVTHWMQLEPPEADNEG